MEHLSWLEAWSQDLAEQAKPELSLQRREYLEKCISIYKRICKCIKTQQRFNEYRLTDPDTSNLARQNSNIIYKFHEQHLKDLSDHIHELDTAVRQSLDSSEQKNSQGIQEINPSDDRYNQHIIQNHEEWETKYEFREKILESLAKYPEIREKQKGIKDTEGADYPNRQYAQKVTEILQMRRSNLERLSDIPSTVYEQHKNVLDKRVKFEKTLEELCYMTDNSALSQARLNASCEKLTKWRNMLSQFQLSPANDKILQAINKLEQEYEDLEKHPPSPSSSLKSPKWKRGVLECVWLA
jgi:hypothetical protein